MNEMELHEKVRELRESLRWAMANLAPHILLADGQNLWGGYRCVHCEASAPRVADVAHPQSCPYIRAMRLQLGVLGE